MRKVWKACCTRTPTCPTGMPDDPKPAASDMTLEEALASCMFALSNRFRCWGPDGWRQIGAAISTPPIWPKALQVEIGTMSMTPACQPHLHSPDLTPGARAPRC